MIEPIEDAPDRLLGLWIRESLKLADGSEDRTTRVFWGQTRRGFVDLRIPQDRIHLGSEEEVLGLNPDALSSLGRQKGFAGHIRLIGNECTWVRDIDFQPRTGRPDKALVRVEDDMLYEEGQPSSVVGAAYQEIYRRTEQGRSRLAMLRLLSCEGVSSASKRGMLILIDNRFMFARGRSHELQSQLPLQDHLREATRDPVRIHDLLDCEISIGAIGIGSANWTIDHSTLPWREGKPAWEPGQVGVDGRQLTITGATSSYKWQIEECSVAPIELAPLFAN